MVLFFFFCFVLFKSRFTKVSLPFDSIKSHQTNFTQNVDCIFMNLMQSFCVNLSLNYVVFNLSHIHRINEWERINVNTKILANSAQWQWMCNEKRNGDEEGCGNGETGNNQRILLNRMKQQTLILFIECQWYWWAKNQVDWYILNLIKVGSWIKCTKQNRICIVQKSLTEKKEHEPGNYREKNPFEERARKKKKNKRQIYQRWC